MHLLTPIKYLWTLPTTLVGLLVIPPTLLTGGRVRVVRGVLEVHGGLTTWLLRGRAPLIGHASAMTLGHVILGQDRRCLDRSRDHEHVHVRQAERWGPAFIPAYLLASLIVRLRGGDAYYDNPFEQEAYGTADE